MTVSAGQLSRLLEAELTTLQALEEALEKEHRALLANGVDGLEASTAIKNSAVEAHRKQQQQRLDWSRALGLGSDASLAVLSEHCGSAPGNDSFQRELVALAEACQVNNRRNGVLITRLQERARGALQVLRREDGGDLYSLSGSREHRSDSRTLGKA